MDTFNKVREIISKQLGIDISSIAMESTIDNLGGDSLDIVEMIMKIEDEFGIEIDDSKIEQLKTVAETVNYIDSILNK